MKLPYKRLTVLLLLCVSGVQSLALRLIVEAVGLSVEEGAGIGLSLTLALALGFYWMQICDLLRLFPDESHKR